jgi:Lrp/AsnC family transcriptional regulator, leucine-responsive regulatory protein
MPLAIRRTPAFDSETLMDAINWQILAELQKDARLSMAKLGRRVGLSAPAATQRVHRMEDAGIIKGYRAVVDCRALGRRVLAFVRISARGNIKEKVLQKVREAPEVLECHRGSANECFILKVSVRSIEDLESLADRFLEFGELTTTIVLSSLLESRTIDELPVE